MLAFISLISDFKRDNIFLRILLSPNRQLLIFPGLYSYSCTNIIISLFRQNFDQIAKERNVHQKHVPVRMDTHLRIDTWHVAVHGPVH